jgi:hypothetical protein
MAQSIRNTHELATIRVNLRPSRSGMELSFASFLGTTAMERFDLPAEVVGIQSELSVRAYRDVQFQLPPEVVSLLSRSLLETSDDEPFWLQVGSSAGHLAVVPWERYLQPPLGRPLLRIPNFVADPVFLSGPLRAALVVSSPRAKTPFDVLRHVSDLIATAEMAAMARTELHVFADVDVVADVEALMRLRKLRPGHMVVVHDPAEAEAYGEGETAFVGGSARGLEDRIDSPWLRWIRDSLRGQALDLVHFVCPGFFRRDQGALALARSPGRNEDRRWSHFVGADELISFLDLMGTWSVGFSPPYENVWAIGLRLLADRLAWQRPGALFVHDAEHGTSEELLATYRFLFSSEDAEPPNTSNVSLYTHPRRIQRYRTSGVEAYGRSMRGGYGISEAEAIPEQLAKLAVKADRADQADAPPPRVAWQSANELQLDRMLLDVGTSDTPTRRGALDALEGLQRIFRTAGEETAGGTTTVESEA